MCDKCSDERKDKPVLGMTILRNVKQNADDKDVWDGGEILDPNNGKIYRLRLKPLDGGKTARGARLHRRRSCRTRPGSASSDDAEPTGASMNRFNVRKVAVLGAGVMGAQIAAHLVNVKVPVVLFDLPAKEGPKNGIVTKAIEGLKKLKPAPLGVPEDAALIQAGQLRRAPRPAEGLRPGHRGDRRAHGLEARPVQAASRRHVAPHAIVASQHLGPVDHQAVAKRCPRRSSRASAASTSSTRRATWRWWS